MVPFDQDEIRHNLSLWFQDDQNAAALSKLHKATPSDIIPFLPVVGGIEPVEGWTEYLKGRDWKFRGKRIAKQGVWVGAIELEAMNELLLNTGYDIRETSTTPQQSSFLVRPGTLVGKRYLSSTWIMVTLKSSSQ